MSIGSLTRDARQALARALEALQASDAPPALLTVAEPLAKAMGALVEIENGKKPTAAQADAALEALREGLMRLQLPEHFQHQAAERSMTSVAEALRLARDIAEQLPRGPAAAVTAGEREPELRAIEAELGALSATNFYKGLASGDIVASGGLFVATYQVPPVGQKVLLKVSMPGGYEFEAKGVVAWTRDIPANSTAPGAIPGFGAQFSEITEEGRGLIQRYVRNREPLFHDDL